MFREIGQLFFTRQELSAWTVNAYSLRLNVSAILFYKISQAVPIVKRLSDDQPDSRAERLYGGALDAAETGRSVRILSPKAGLKDEDEFLLRKKDKPATHMATDFLMEGQVMKRWRIPRLVCGDPPL